MKLEKSTSIPRPLCQIDLLSLFVLFVLSDHVIVPQRIFSNFVLSMRICEHNLWKDKKKFPKEHHVVWIGKTKHTYICSQRWLYNFIIYVLRNTHQKTMSQVFHTQMSSGKSGEQTMFLHVWEKWYNQSQVTEVCDIRTKIQAFYIGACSLQCSRFARSSQTFNKKRISRRVFLVKKLKNIPEIGVE